MQKKNMAGMAQLDSELTRFSSRFPRLITSLTRGIMLFPVHKGLGISRNIEQSVVKVLVIQYHYLAANPPTKWSVSSKRIADYSLV
jgi:hypothetical protein